MPFSGSVGGDKVVGSLFSRGFAEKFHLSLAFPVRHATMDQGDLTGEAEFFESAHEEVCRIAVLGEDNEFLVGVFGILEHIAESLEFGFFACVVQFPCFVEQLCDSETFLLELGETERDGAGKSAGLEIFMLLAAVSARGLLISRPRFELVVEVIKVSLLLRK